LRGNRIGEEESVSLGVEAGSRSWEKSGKKGDMRMGEEARE
jgi:hypothetical protein